MLQAKEHFRQKSHSPNIFYLKCMHANGEIRTTNQNQSIVGSLKWQIAFAFAKSATIATVAMRMTTATAAFTTIESHSIPIFSHT